MNELELEGKLDSKTFSWEDGESLTLDDEWLIHLLWDFVGKQVKIKITLDGEK